MFELYWTIDFAKFIFRKRKRKRNKETRKRKIKKIYWKT